MTERPDVDEEVLTAHLDGEAVLLHMHSKRYYRLNETGQRIWRLLEEGLAADAIAARLVEEYEVDEPTATAAVIGLIDELRAEGLVRGADERST